jgi:hypothetical protein
MTPFCFEHELSAPSPAAVFAAYFDPDHQREQDRAVEILAREVLELDDRPDELRRVCRVVPLRQLPALVQKFSSGPLHYVETLTWRRSEDELAITLRPSLMRGRILIDACYRLDPVSPGVIRRRYAGTVSVNVSLVSGRVERGILADLERSTAAAAAATQGWLDRQSITTVPARTQFPANSRA